MGIPKQLKFAPVLSGSTGDPLPYCLFLYKSPRGRNKCQKKKNDNLIISTLIIMEYVKGEPSAFFKNVSANSFDDLTLESTS